MFNILKHLSNELSILSDVDILKKYEQELCFLVNIRVLGSIFSLGIKNR